MSALVDRRLTAKALDRGAATTVLALRAVRARDDVNLMRLVVELAEFGCQVKLIRLLVGGVSEAMVQRLVGKITRSKGGHPPATLGGILKSPDLHLQASVFLNHFICYHRMNGSDAFDPDVFIRALRHYNAQMLAINPGGPELSPWYSYLIGREFLRGGCDLTHCKCGVYFLQTTEPVQVLKTSRCGDCPSCAMVFRRNRNAKRAQKLGAFRTSETPVALNEIVVEPPDAAGASLPAPGRPRHRNTRNLPG